MRRYPMKKSITLMALLLALLMSIVPFGVARAQQGDVMIYAVSVSNKLLSFSSSTPGTIQKTMQITGLQANENVLGIDFRPATGQLYGLGSTSRLYTIDTTSGTAVQVGSVLTTTLVGTHFGFDFNPTVDRIRITSNEDQNLRVNPNNAAIGAIDGTLAYTSTDANAGKNPNVVASAYTNNVPGPTSTTLYDIDTTLDVLVTQNPPNSGTLNTVGPLGQDATDVTGFDIADANTAFASLSLSNGAPNTTGLYSVNLTTGAITSIDSIGGGEAIVDISAALSATPATVTPVVPTATPAASGTAVATAPAATATTATTAPPAATTTIAPAVSTPTSLPPAPTQMPAQPTPTTAPPGMPVTGGGDTMTPLALVLLALALVSAGWLSSRRGARAPK
jgi:Domain of unknown function (DUF4394)